jgi:hypothetical protein
MIGKKHACLDIFHAKSGQVGGEVELSIGYSPISIEMEEDASISIIKLFHGFC